MGIRVNKVFLLCLCIVLLLWAFPSCSDNGGTFENDSNNGPNITSQDKFDNYNIVPFNNSIIHKTDSLVSWISDDILFVRSFDEYSKLNIESTSNYDDSYFNDKFLVVIQFEHAGGEKVRELSGVVIKDELLCPVISIDSQEDLQSVLMYSLIIIEVSKEYSGLGIGEILVINNFDSSRGSSKYSKFD